MFSVYFVKEEAPVLLLAIDVTSVATRSGQLDFICQQLCNLLLSLDGYENIHPKSSICGVSSSVLSDSLYLFKREEDDTQSDLRVGLITYDSRLHLYNLSPMLSRPHMMVLTDTDELELPVQDGLLVPLKDCRCTVGRY